MLVTSLAVIALSVTAFVLPRADAADPGVPVVYIAQAENFPDALAGSVIATSHNAPLLLVSGPDAADTIPDSVRTELSRLEPEEIVILGGTAAVSVAVETELAAFTDGPVTRLEGSDRFETAVEIAQALPGKVGDADRLDGFDSSAFARPPLRMRHGAHEFHAATNADLLRTDVATLIASGSGSAEAVAPITAPTDAHVDPDIAEQVLFGELTELDVCYTRAGADRTGSVEVIDTLTRDVLVDDDVTWTQTGATTVECLDVALPTDDSLERTAPLTLRITLDATSGGDALALAGFRSQWDTFTFVPTGP